MKGDDAFPGRPDGGAVQRMFSEIAPRYDFLNHFLSASVDRRWRRAAVRRLNVLIAINRETVCLDLCSGTGDLALELHRTLGAKVVASDFCHPMLSRAETKIRSGGLLNSVRTVEADALSLPFADASFEGITIAFGLRNLEDRDRGLKEMRRVLKPGGGLVILEFSRPVIPIFRHVFQFYFRHILPKVGALISGQRAAYQYLPDSVGKFLSQRDLASAMSSLGFKEVNYENLSGGIAALHWGRKT